MEKLKLTDSDFELLRTYIENSCGIALGNGKEYIIESRLAGIMNDNGCQTFKDLYNAAVRDRTLALRDKIVDAITTNETLWFRDRWPFLALEEVLLKEYLSDFTMGKRGKLRIWSAGCSTGQEPYSIAMTLCQFNKDNPEFPLRKIEIIATDISPSALFLAMAGRYDKLSVSRGLPDDLLNQYFVQKDKIYVIQDDIKKMVTFKKFNLQDNFLTLGQFDLIFCRNVLIYFSDDFKREIFSKMVRQLIGKGRFFSGASEILLPFTNEFEPVKFEGHSFYQVKQGN